MLGIMLHITKVILLITQVGSKMTQKYKFYNPNPKQKPPIW